MDNSAHSDRGLEFLDVKGEVDIRLTFAEIRSRARTMAGSLLGLGLERGDAVGIVAMVNPDFVSAFFACQYAGLVAVPLPVVSGMGAARGYERHLARLLSTAHARVALGPASSLGHLREAAHGLELRAICTADDLAVLPSAGGPGQPLGPDEISHIQFSSGSTAFPKGIEISQRALMANLLGIIDSIEMTPNDRIVSWLPFYHDMGLIGQILVPAVAAIDVHFLPTDGFVRRPLLWPQLISSRRATISFSPTFGYDLAARRGLGSLESGLDLSCWRAAGLGGDMIQKPVLDRFARTFEPAGFDARAFLPSYGLAESTLAVSFSHPGRGIRSDHVVRSSIERLGHQVEVCPEDGPDCRHVISCGYVLADHKIEIRDQDNRPLPDRHIGVVHVKGPSLMDGYHRDEQATRETLSEDGWLDTGDMGYLSEGALHITGRRKDMIIINARNIWPQDIEWHAEQSVPGLRTRDTAAFLHYDEVGGERAVLLVQSRLTAPEELRRLKKEVHSAVLCNIGVDCQVELVPPKTLPFTTSGKLMRAQARTCWLELRNGKTNGHPDSNGHAPVNGHSDSNGHAGSNGHPAAKGRSPTNGHASLNGNAPVNGNDARPGSPTSPINGHGGPHSAAGYLTTVKGTNGHDAAGPV